MSANNPNSSDGDKLNLDLISMVQQARMMHDAEAKPSEMAAVYWIEAKDRTGIPAAPTTNVGEWVIDTDLTQVDALWEQIKTATETGKLGYKSKVSTTARSREKGVQHREIVIRMGDLNQTAEIQRAWSTLHDLGFTDLPEHPAPQR